MTPLYLNICAFVLLDLCPGLRFYLSIKVYPLNAVLCLMQCVEVSEGGQDAKPAKTFFFFYIIHVHKVSGISSLVLSGYI